MQLPASSAVMTARVLLLSTLTGMVLLPRPAGALHNGMELVPSMGWSNWESAGCNINEDLIRRSADALVAKGLAAAGYKTVGVDDCWAELGRNATGHLVANTTLFPSGMRALGDFLHERGLKFRIYSSAGVHTCQQNMSGSLGHEWLDAQTFAEMGADAVKYDDCASELYAQVLEDAPRRYPFNPPAIIKFPIMGLALNQTGRNISYMCNFPWEFWTRDWPAKGGRWVSELCNSWRTGSDARAGFDGMFAAVQFAETFADQVPSGPGGWNHLDAMQIGNNRSYYWAHAERGRRSSVVRDTGGNAPPGPPFEGTPMTEAQEHTIFSLYALVKTPMMIGADPITLTGHSLATYLNKEVIAVSQDPLGKRGRKVSTRLPPPPNCQVWCGDLADGGVFVVLVNNGAALRNVSVEWADMGLAANASFRARDVWRHTDLKGVLRGRFAASVAPKGCVAVRLTGVAAPVLPPGEAIVQM